MNVRLGVMTPIPDKIRILHLGSDPSESSLLSAELEAEGLPGLVNSASTERALRTALEAGDITLVVADLPLPWESAASCLSELQRARPELQVIFRAGSTGNRTVTEAVSQTARAVREALAHRSDIGRTPEEQRELIQRVVQSQAAQLRLSRRDFWDFQEALRDITSSAAELLDVGRAGYWEVEPGTSKLKCLQLFDRGQGGHAEVNELELGPRYLAALEQAIFLAADDARHDPRTSEFTAAYLSKLGITSMLDAPVRRDGRIVGVLCHEHIGPARHWSVLDQCSAAAMADIVVRALEVRDRRRAEARLREAEKFEVIGRLAGRLAHDFNNLLTVILGNAQLALQRQPADSADRDGLEQIIRAGEDSTGLIRQLLAYSRHEIVVPRVLDLRAEISAVVPMVQRLLGADVSVRCELGSKPCWVEIDPTQLQQVLLNLAANARDAMPHGGELHLTLSSASLPARVADEQPRSLILLRVRDTGAGIAPESLPRIFEPFFTTKEAKLGTGLGLASVAEIVRRAGGEVSAKSRPGQGATFDIQLPEVTDPAARRAGAAPSKAANWTVKNFKTTTALIVQSDAPLRRAMASQLAEQQIGVLEASGPVEALEWLARGSQFDAVVTDYVLPKMDGVRLIGHLRDFRPNLPAVLVAEVGRCSQIELEALRKTGATELLAKPLIPGDLAGSLARLR